MLPVTHATGTMTGVPRADHGAPASRRTKTWTIAALLAGAVLAVYLPTWGDDFDFVNFDDDRYVTINEHVRQGLSPEGAAWAFTSLDAFNWHPLTWLSLQLDAQLFGTTAPGFHRTNVLLHTANTLLLFGLLCRLTGAVWPCAAVAAFFGLHPAHVEAVAWVTARKDVLSTLFWLLATAAYAGYARRPAMGRYLLVAGLLALGLMAKPMLVTLPAVLLLLDYWPLGRWPAPADGTARYVPATARRLVAEKLPLFLLAVPVMVLTVRAQAPLLKPLDDYSTYHRLANALVSYMRYLGMAVWPVDLAVLYPLPNAAPPVWQVAAAGALLASLTAACLWAGRSQRYFAVGWLWFLGTLVPVIGLVQNGPQAMADRYTYVPYIGLSFIPAWAAAWWCGRDERRCLAAAVLAGGTLACCLGLTWRQIGVWRDSETLWRHALAATGDQGGAHAMLGMALAEQGRLADAAAELEAALRRDPANPATHVNLAAALVSLGRLDEAAVHLERSIALRPGAAKAHFNLAAVRERQGRDRDAADQFALALALDPRLTEAGIRRAAALARLGDYAAARAQLDRLLRDAPDAPRLHVELGKLLKREGKPAEALACYDRALALGGDDPNAWNNKGVALEWLGRLGEAASCYRHAVDRRPDELVYRLNLAYVQSARGQPGAAAEQFRAAFQLQPRWPEFALAEAWTLATDPEPRRRDGALALRTAVLVCAATDDRMARALDARAAAHAELGQFTEAVAWQRRAVELLPGDVPPAVRAAVTARLRCYERGQPYREPAREPRAP